MDTHKVSVDLGKNSYDIIIGKNFYKEFSKYIKNIYNKNKIYIITDNNVHNIYKKHYKDMFSNYEYEVFVMEAGEKNKTLSTMEKIYNDMIDKNIKRSDLVVALGGGVVGDVAGFVAATYLRGVNFVQIPTTIIAQVDSSIGGKVGVDMPQGKNLIGAFYQPKLVLIDEMFLNSLSDRHFFNGFAEIVKYGCIYDMEFFEYIEQLTNTVNIRENLMENICEIIERSCEIKKYYVQNDEKESNIRMILNFGHTIGHAIEQYTNYEKYLHGESVSIGMIEIIKIGIEKNITNKNLLNRVKKILEKLNLPVETNINLENLKDIMKRDKKSTNDGINFIFLKELGETEVIKICI